MTQASTANKAQLGFSPLPDKDILDFENVYGAHHYSRQHVVVRKAEGLWVYDVDGNRYLDCLAAYSAANQGHAHPRIVKAMVEALQGSYAGVISNVVYTDSLGLFLKKLATIVPQLGERFGANGNKVLPKNGETSAVAAVQ